MVKNISARNFVISLLEMTICAQVSVFSDSFGTLIEVLHNLYLASLVIVSFQLILHDNERCSVSNDEKFHGLNMIMEKSRGII